MSRETKKMKFQIKTGSEYHTTEWRSCMVYVLLRNESPPVPVYQALKVIESEWELVGNKGRHGKWCIAEYEVPLGTKLRFVAKANDKPVIQEDFIVDDNTVDIDGYNYNHDICGWIVSIET